MQFASRLCRNAAQAVAAAAMLIAFHASAADEWPTHPIKMIVPYAPGGGTDIIARAVASKLSARLGQPIIVENKSGAGGSLGVDLAAHAQPDGYTILFMTTAFATNAATGMKLPYDAIKDFQPVGEIGETPLLVVVPTDSKVKTLGDLVQVAREKPNTVTYGSSGVGSMSHLGMQLLATETKVQFLHVPYKGMAPAFTDLVAGNVQAALCTFASATSLLNAGKVRAVALASDKRSGFATKLPTAAEEGFPDFKIDFWWGLMVPARVPPSIVKKLNSELNTTLQQPEMQKVLAREAAVPTPGSSEEFGKRVSSEIVRWSKLVKDSNIAIN